LITCFSLVVDSGAWIEKENYHKPGGGRAGSFLRNPSGSHVHGVGEA